LPPEGRSNREIACELYVTLKAVEGHLARAYAKPGIEGRGGLHPGAPLPGRRACLLQLMHDRLEMLEQLGLIPAPG